MAAEIRPRSARAQRLRALAAATLLALAATGLTAAAAAPGERPPVGAGALSIRIESVTPAIPTEAGSLFLRGSITNTSDRPVTRVSAALRISTTPLVGRAEIPAVLAGQGLRIGQTVPGTTYEVADELAPGAASPFRLSARVADLGLGGPGVYVTGAEALADAGAGVVRQDLDRTFLPWWPKGTDAQPLLLTLLWPVSGRPVRDVEGVLTDEGLAVDMSPAGRLSTLVETASARQGAFTWVIDPEVIEAAAQMSQGYLVRTTPGADPVRGTREAEVSQWLTQVTDAVTDPQASAVGSLYATPDVMAARGGRLLNRVLAQRGATDAATRAVVGQPLPSRMALIPGGNADDAALLRLARQDVSPVVLSDWALPPEAALTFTPSGNVTLGTEAGDLPVLLADSGLSAALQMPAGSPAEVTAMRQRLLAETLLTVEELPADQRLLVAAPPIDWSPSASAARAVLAVAADTAWIRPLSVAAALRREASSVPRIHVPYGATLADDELPEGYVDRVRGHVRGLEQYAGVISDPSGLPAVAVSAPLREMGSWFRTRRGERTALQSAVDAQVSAALGSVSVVSSGSITVSGASGTIPITVENTGTLPVTVSLELTSSPPQLFDADPVGMFQIAPGRRTSVEVAARVTGGGQIPVTIQPVTAQHEPFGEPAQLVVRSSAYANAARILVQAALALLVLTVAVHGIRRARRAGRRAPGSGGA